MNPQEFLSGLFKVVKAYLEVQATLQVLNDGFMEPEARDTAHEFLHNQVLRMEEEQHLEMVNDGWEFDEEEEECGAGSSEDEDQ